MTISKTLLDETAHTLLDKAEGCFDLAKAHHNLAEKLHEDAVMQQENAHKQQEIAVLQHNNADELEAKADPCDLIPIRYCGDCVAKLRLRSSANRDSV